MNWVDNAGHFHVLDGSVALCSENRAARFYAFYY